MNVRTYWELAESVHPGPMRLYAKELTAYLGRVLALVGTDEYHCRVCGRSNVRPDGTRAPGSFVIWSDGAAFCEDHRAEFHAHSEADLARRTVVEAQSSAKEE